MAKFWLRFVKVISKTMFFIISNRKIIFSFLLNQIKFHITAFDYDLLDLNIQTSWANQLHRFTIQNLNRVSEMIFGVTNQVA